MAYLEDLAPCDYFGGEYADVLTAVGWLSDDVSFRIGQTPQASYEKTKALLIEPWQFCVFAGIHHCELCQFDPPAGHRNLFIPNGTTIFVCPELITHYIAAHQYRPPDEFLAAVDVCPDGKSMEYKKLLLASGGRRLVAPQR
jgi:hypothetical protein